MAEIVSRKTASKLRVRVLLCKHLQLISINGAPLAHLTRWPHDDKSTDVIAKDECRRGLSNSAPPGGRPTGLDVQDASHLFLIALHSSMSIKNAHISTTPTYFRIVRVDLRVYFFPVKLSRLQLT